MTNIEHNHDKAAAEPSSQVVAEYYNNNYNNIYAGTGRVMRPEECEAIKEAYNDNIGAMTGAVAKIIEQAFEAGLTSEEIIMAIEETGLAPNPSPYYMRAILKNWAESGVTVSRIRHLSRTNNASKWWK